MLLGCTFIVISIHHNDYITIYYYYKCLGVRLTMCCLMFQHVLHTKYVSQLTITACQMNDHVLTFSKVFMFILVVKCYVS